MDITDQVLKHFQIYGSSDNTDPAYNSSSRQLNYSSGPSIQRPEVTNVGTMPYTLKFQDSVGLFGAENHFVRVNLNLEGDTITCFEEPFWQCARLSEETEDPSDPYTLENDGTTPGQAYIDRGSTGVLDDYEPALLVPSRVPTIYKPKVRIDLRNLKTGNQYVDVWLDVRLYTSDRKEHPYDIMYCDDKDFFYIGFHARNTRRLPYNVEVTIGEEYKTIDQIEDRYLMHRIE
jgi:hypothetical protein